MRVPKALFRSGLTKMLDQMARMPTRRHAGSRLRASVPTPFPRALLAAELSVSHGLPETSEEVGIERAEDGSVKPTKTTATSEKTKLKFQDPALVKGFARFQTRFPQRGSGSTKLLLAAAAEKRGLKATRAATLAGPMILGQREATDDSDEAPDVSAKSVSQYADSRLMRNGAPQPSQSRVIQ